MQEEDRKAHGLFELFRNHPSSGYLTDSVESWNFDTDKNVNCLSHFR